MRMSRVFAGLLSLGLLAGCSNVGGTWISQTGSDKARSPIGRVTFANDGTFTAEADYGPEKGKQAMSGTYAYDNMNGVLSLDAGGQQRKYDVKIEGDQMTVSKHGATGKDAPQKFGMTRMKGKSMWGM